MRTLQVNPGGRLGLYGKMHSRFTKCPLTLMEKMTHKISLSENEQRLAEWVWKKRTANARRKNLPDTKVGDQSFEETDLEGFAAELAFCKLMNIYPDLETGDNLPKKLFLNNSSF